MKSYFAMGVIVALSWLGLAAGVRAQQPNFSSPSLLPLPDVQPEYPTTPYPSAPSSGYDAGPASWSSQRGPMLGQQRFAQNPGGSLPQGNTGSVLPQGAPEQVPTPATATPDIAPQDYGHSPSDKVQGYGSNKPQGAYMDAMSGPYGGTASGEEGGFGAGDACGYGGGMIDGGMYGGGGGGWWGSVGGLYMGRDRGNPLFWSYFDSNEAGQFQRQDYMWGGGVQASVGHCFSKCCGTWGVEGVYWGLYPGTNTQTLFAGAQPGNLNAILNFNQLNYNGVLASNVTNGASAHRLQSGYQIHNVEVNLLNYSLCGGGACSKFNYSLGAGFRWFRFQDTLQFAADRTGANFNGAVDELYYDIQTTNDLIGFQLIGQSSYCLTNKLTATMGTKFGLFGNHIQHLSHIYGAAGDAVINNGPNAGRAWNINNSTNTVSFLGELDAGLTYAIGCHWSIYAGYRVVGLSNVGLTTNQVFPDLRGINDVEVINFNGSMILHGGYAGVQFCW